MKKVIILLTSSVIIIGVAALLILNKSSTLDRRTNSPFDVNPQALSNGLIGMNEKYVPEAGGKEAALYIESCAFCHDLPDPSSHDAIEWGFVIERMETLIVEVKNQKGVAIPWDGDRGDRILGYLQRHAFQGMNPDDLPDSPERGAKLFKEACAACHTLPDPSMHSMRVWEYVLSKMQQFQKEMGEPVMSEEEVEAVLGYVGAVSGQPI